MQPRAGRFPVSRRSFVAGSTALVGTASLRLPRAFAAARYTRKSLESADSAKDVERYGKAVKAMLALPPSDPRNWYRNAFTHLLDCPHGNWWFLVWHRGFLAHLEKICRQVSNEPDFALPFWDWTKEPKVPDSFWENELNPGSPLFIRDPAVFDRDYKPAMKAYWDSFSQDQLMQQKLRGYNNFEVFWRTAMNAFLPNGRSRVLTAAQPDLPNYARVAVSESKIRDLLAPDAYVTEAGRSAFETAQAANHHAHTRDKSILESEPHDNVHDAINGFMARFLSPVDPIFFMHHSNIDRLWTVWTRAQQGAGKPTRPPARLWPTFSREPFLFYTNADGTPAGQTTAGDVFDNAPFDYDYAPGTGDSFAGELVARATPSDVTTAGNLNKAFQAGRLANSALAVPQALGERLEDSRSRLFTRITITAPENAEDLIFDVYIAGADARLVTSRDSNNYAGSFTFFGPPRVGMEAGFTIGITDTVMRLRAAGELKSGDELQVAVVPTPAGTTFKALAETDKSAAALNSGTLTSVSVGAF